MANQMNYIIVNGISYHKNTSQEVIDILEKYRGKRIRIHIHYGDVKTGRDWCEENDVDGYIGNSIGPMKVPLLVPRGASGGCHILDHCIVKIRTLGKKGITVYQHPKYHHREFQIRAIGPQETGENGKNLLKMGLTAVVTVDGADFSRFRSMAKAVDYLDKLGVSYERQTS